MNNMVEKNGMFKTLVCYLNDSIWAFYVKNINCQGYIVFYKNFQVLKFLQNVARYY